MYFCMFKTCWVSGVFQNLKYLKCLKNIWRRCLDFISTCQFLENQVFLWTLKQLEQFFFGGGRGIVDNFFWRKCNLFGEAAWKPHLFSCVQRVLHFKLFFHSVLPIIIIISRIHTPQKTMAGNDCHWSLDLTCHLTLDTWSDLPAEMLRCFCSESPVEKTLNFKL